MKQLIVLPLCTLTRTEKARLSKAGFCCLEVEDPAQVRLINSEVGDLNGNVIARIVMSAILNATSLTDLRERIVKHLAVEVSK